MKRLSTSQDMKFEYELVRRRSMIRNSDNEHPYPQQEAVFGSDNDLVYHAVPVSVYDQVMQEGLKPTLSNNNQMSDKPRIHATGTPDQLSSFGSYLYNTHGPFHIISAPKRYFQFAPVPVEESEDDDFYDRYDEWEEEVAERARGLNRGTGSEEWPEHLQNTDVEPLTYYTDQHIPANELQLVHHWDDDAMDEIIPR